MYAANDRMRVGVIGTGSGAGTGFVIASLARHLYEHAGLKPSVLELGKGGLYDSLGMDKHFAGRTFFSFHKAASENRSIRGRRNDYLGVNWMLANASSGGLPFLDIFQKLRLVNHAAGDIILCRLSGVGETYIWPLLKEMDKILIIIDPLPSKMLEGYQFLCKLRVKNLPLIYVVNRYNDGVNRREMVNFLSLCKLIYLPALPAKEIYKAEYLCRCAFDMPLAAKALDKPLKDLTAALFKEWAK